MNSDTKFVVVQASTSGKIVKATYGPFDDRRAAELWCERARKQDKGSWFAVSELYFASNQD